MTHRYVVVDAFASEPLKGNPVAVFFEADDMSSMQMQRVAAEMHLSEVTFVLSPTRSADARVRIFTPVNELPFAGHPLLGTAIALGADTTQHQLVLETATAMVPFDLERADGHVIGATMRQPPPTWLPFDREQELLAALGVERSTLPVEIYHNGPRHVFVALPEVSTLSGLHPDQRALAAFPDMATNCVAPLPDGSWRARMFSPAYGVVEDAATGSAAGPLAVHLVRHRRLEPGAWVDIIQGVEIGRPSLMRAVARMSGAEVLAVEVQGRGATFAHGTALI